MRRSAMAADPLDALRLPVVPVDPRPRFTDDLLRQIEAAAGGRPDPAWPRAGTRAGTRAGIRENPTIRYFVNDLDTAVAFYCGRLGFEQELVSTPGFAMLYRGGLRLLLSVPGVPGGGAPLPDGSVPQAGGWNRMTLQVADITRTVEALRAAGVAVRAGVTTGVAVRQALVQDPWGNLIELFEPAVGYHERA
jgi:catechol 2,3-dioxygenase-like lactoylglutathione lyase family enzyme